MARKYPPEVIRRMCDMYVEGQSIRQIAAKFNASYGGVHHNLTTHGIVLRKRSDYTKKPAKRAA